MTRRRGDVCRRHVRGAADRVERAQRERLPGRAVVDDRADPPVVGVTRTIHEDPVEHREGLVRIRVLDPDRLDDGHPVAHPRPTAIDGVLDAVQKLEPGRHFSGR